MSVDSQNEWLGNYVKLNVGGSLFYTTIATLTSEDSMLKALFSGRMDVKTDDDGWVLLDRSGKHFGIILNYLRDGAVPLPESRQDLEELLVETRFYCIEGLKNACETQLEKLHEERKESQQQHAANIMIVKYPKVAKAILATTRKPIVKLTMNRYNNVFSYTSNSHDNLLRNIECLEKYALMFADRILFMKDVRDKCEQNEICEWGFYWRSQKLKSIDCIAIHYSSEKRLIKVEFPESRIHEEMLFLLSISDRELTDAELFDVVLQRGSGGSGSGAAGGSLMPPVGGVGASTANTPEREETQNEINTDQLGVFRPSVTVSGPDEETRTVPIVTTRASLFPRATSGGSNSRSSFGSCRLIRR